MASRGVKITLGIVGGVLALVVLAVLGLVGWALFRPLLPGDYSHTRGDIRTASELNDIALEAMVVTVGTPISGEAKDQLDNRIANTSGQIDVVLESVDEAVGSRAGEKDETLQAQLNELRSAYADLQDSLNQWQSQGYADIGWALKLCRTPPSDVDDPDQACTEAAASLPDAGAAPELAALAEAVTDYADSARGVDDTQALDAAQEEFAGTVGALWDRVSTSLEQVDGYLAEKES